MGINDVMVKLKGKFTKKQFSDEKTVAPPSLPDTAKDMFEDSSFSDEQIEQKPAVSTDAAPNELPDIDFESEPENIEVKEDVFKEEHRIIPKESSEVPVVEEDMFHSAMADVYRDEIPEEKLDEEPKTPDHGFFSEFQRFVKGNDINNIDELARGDLLEKMKEYHKHKNEGKPYYFHTDELKEDLHNTLGELKELEREWFSHRQRMEKEEDLVGEKEKLIEEKLEKIRFLSKNMKHREEFKHEVGQDKKFKLNSGQDLNSLSDLTAALRVMGDEDFKYHVGGKNNDFAGWVEGVLEDKKLADSMKKCKTREELIDLLTSFELQ